MPELPDITIYIEALEKRIVDEPLERVRVMSPFFLRTADPPLGAIEGQVVGQAGCLLVLKVQKVEFPVAISVGFERHTGAVRREGRVPVFGRMLREVEFLPGFQVEEVYLPVPVSVGLVGHDARPSQGCGSWGWWGGC